MKISNVFSGRPQFYDRNPSTKVFSSNVGAGAPAGNTNPWAYTVPAGRKFALVLIQAAVARVTAATTAGQVAAGILITPNGGSLGTVVYSQINSNGLGDNSRMASSGVAVFVAGDVIQASVQDTSVAGTTDRDVNMSGTEFDA